MKKENSRKVWWGEMKVRKQTNKVLQTKIAVQTTMPIGTVHQYTLTRRRKVRGKKRNIKRTTLSFLYIL